jgi:hypothetical protein
MLVRKNLFSAPVVVGLLLAARSVFSQPEFRPGETWLDTSNNPIQAHGGGILPLDNTFYWFGEDRTPGGRGAVACYSSTNLYDWKREGVALARPADTNSEFARGCIVERPKVLRNPQSGRYMMWFHLELRGRGYAAARAAVAVSDAVTGPYQFLKSFRPNGNMSRDMTLYLDEDGQAYQIYSSRDNYDLRICRLSDDFLSATTNDVLIASDHREAPALFKYLGKYYLITSACTGWTPNQANYYTADRILGPWTAHPNPCRGPNAETTFDGQSTFVLPVPGRPGAFILMADRWKPRNLPDSRYVWLPVQFDGDDPIIEWRDTWNLNSLGKQSESH